MFGKLFETSVVRKFAERTPVGFEMAAIEHIQLIHRMLILRLLCRQFVGLLQMLFLRLPPGVHALKLLLFHRPVVMDLLLFELSLIILVRQRPQRHKGFAKLRADILLRRQQVQPKRVAVISLSHRAVPRIVGFSSILSFVNAPSVARMFLYTAF